MRVFCAELYPYNVTFEMYGLQTIDVKNCNDLDIFLSFRLFVIKNVVFITFHVYIFIL